jgi:hypothetical protein
MVVLFKVEHIDDNFIYAKGIDTFKKIKTTQD